MMWTDGPVSGCEIRSLSRHQDQRGWLIELFRQDEWPRDVHPVMAYVSLTHSGVTRGPHEHVNQSDLFAFISGTFRLYLWDNRSDSPTRGHRSVLEVGEANPVAVQVPPGVIHAYRNIGDADALVYNAPNRLYAGEGKRHPVDEIRWEDQTEHNLILD